MMAAKGKMESGDAEKKISDLKIEMLKQVSKRKSIKKEIARLFTMNRNQTKQGKNFASSDATKSKDSEPAKFLDKKSGGNK